jgi:hypothetical protein
LTRQRLPPVTHTDALFANQSQSILYDLVPLLGPSFPGIAYTQNAVIYNTSGLAKSLNALLQCPLPGVIRKKIYSLGVLPPVTPSGHLMVGDSLLEHAYSTAACLYGEKVQPATSAGRWN